MSESHNPPLNYEASATTTHRQTSTTLPQEVSQCLKNARFLHLATITASPTSTDPLPTPHVSLMNYTLPPQLHLHVLTHDGAGDNNDDQRPKHQDTEPPLEPESQPPSTRLGFASSTHSTHQHQLDRCHAQAHLQLPRADLVLLRSFSTSTPRPYPPSAPRSLAMHGSSTLGPTRRNGAKRHI